MYITYTYICDTKDNKPFTISTFVTYSHLDFLVTVHSAYLLLDAFSVKLYTVYKITTISVVYLTFPSHYGSHAIPQELNHHWSEINDSFIVNHSLKHKVHIIACTKYIHKKKKP